MERKKINEKVEQMAGQIRKACECLCKPKKGVFFDGEGNVLCGDCFKYRVKEVRNG